VLKGAWVAFAAIFLSEWADLGQVTAAGMAMRFVWQEATNGSAVQTAFVVWMGATLAMVSKGTLAIILGAGAKR
jgi:putative Ca2+/H+ antiporter (TMEM165/GDT1 family)